MRLAAGSVIALLVLAPPVLPSAARADAPGWSWPTASRQVVRGFEAPPTPYAAGHRGVDLEAPVGSPVTAVADGVVAFAGTVVDRGVVAIDHDGVRSGVEPVVASVAVGDRVRAGDVIGRLGTGGAHPPGVLHLGARIRTTAGWAYVSPLLYLGGVRRAVLLPLAAFPG